MIQKEKNVQNYDCAFFFFLKKILWTLILVTIFQILIDTYI